MSNEVLSSQISLKGNVMSLVIRKKYNDEKSQNAPRRQDNVKQSSIHTAEHTVDTLLPTSLNSSTFRNQQSLENLDRSNNFWSSYKNFILCNKSIELRITKLFSFENTQYVVAYSANIYNNTNNVDKISKVKQKSFKRKFVVDFIKFMLSDCIIEIANVEHVSDHQFTIEIQLTPNNTITPHEGIMDSSEIELESDIPSTTSFDLTSVSSGTNTSHRSQLLPGENEEVHYETLETSAKNFPENEFENRTCVLTKDITQSINCDFDIFDMELHDRKERNYELDREPLNIEIILFNENHFEFDNQKTVFSKDLASSVYCDVNSIGIVCNTSPELLKVKGNDDVGQSKTYPSRRNRKIAMKISGVVLSLWMIYITFTNFSSTDS